MVFDPKLQSDFSFNRPVGSGQSAIGVIGGLLGDFLSVENSLKGGKSERQPTADERFAIDLQAFQESKGPAFKFDRKGAREFIFKYPQHSDKAVGHFKNIGVMMADPIEQTVDKGLEKYATDPEFIVAAARASSLPEAEREPFMLNYMAQRSSEDAEIQKLERDKKKLEVEGTLNEKRWDILGNRQKDFADNVVSSILQPIVQNVMNGQVEELSPEEQAALGVRYSKVDMNNLSAVLQDTRNYIARQNRETFFNVYGEDVGMPPKEWEERVLGGIDFLIETQGKAADTPQERTAITNALIESNALQKLDKAGLTTATWMLKNLPPEVTTPLLTQSSLMSNFANVLVGADGRIDEEGIPERASTLSTTEAKDIANATIETIGKGGSNYGVFTTFIETARRSGHGVVDGQSFKTIMTNSVDWMKKKANEDPEARTKMQDWFLSDINQTVTLIRRNLPPGVSLSYQGGRYTIIQESITLPSDFKAPGTNLSAPEYAAQRLPQGLKVDDLNSKLSSLKVLGPMGQEVVDTVINQELYPNGRPVSGAGGQDKVKGSAGSDTLSNGSIATKLGIDFGSIETEYGLPSGFLEKTAYIESRGNPKAKNPTSTAGGLFQQIDSNAKAYGVSNRFDPMQSTIGAAKFARDNFKTLSKVLGRAPTGAELYLAHQQGPGGASALLSNPNAKAVDVVGSAAVKLNGGNASMTAGEFANIWISKYNGQRGPISTEQATGQPSAPSFNLEGLSTTPAPEGPAASGAPTAAPTASVAPLASPEVEKVVNELPEDSQSLRVRAIELIKSKPMDADIKALIEALIGGKNA